LLTGEALSAGGALSAGDTLLATSFVGGRLGTSL
jgi:hypothetical protein